jgi:hypothetical protein
MQPEKQRQYLIDPGTRLYAILDGAAIPDLPTMIARSHLPNHCLFTGDLDDDLACVAPYLVYLAPDSDFTDKVFKESPGANWGIFVHSRTSMTEMRRHFRSLIDCITEDGDPIKFRYYDPRVLQKFLPTCTPEELAVFFGRTDAIFAESDDADRFIRFESSGGQLKRTELN